MIDAPKPASVANRKQKFSGKPSLRDECRASICASSLMNRVFLQLVEANWTADMPLFKRGKVSLVAG
jgi:hypothetical protein